MEENQTEKDERNHENTIYVFKKSIELEEKQLESIQKSLESERNKAGILLGFFFLMLIEGLPFFEELPHMLMGFMLFPILLTSILLIKSFCSKRVKSGVRVSGNFQQNWDKNEDIRKFLKKLHDVLKVNIKAQQKLLTTISSNIKIAVITLISIIFILILNSTTPMLINLFNDPGSDNTMSSDVQELSEDSAENFSPCNDQSQDSDNTMESDYEEKGTDK